MTAGDRRSSTLRTAMVPAGGLAALAAVAVGAAMLSEGGPPAGGQPPTDLGRVSTVAFTSFSGCDELLGYYRRHAGRLVGPYGLPGAGWGGPEALEGVARAGAPALASRGGAVPAPSAQAAAADGSASGTGTNVQVAGVDEADLAKRVGDLVLTVASQGTSQGSLRVLRTSGGAVTPVGRLSTGDWYPQQLLVEGNTVLLLGAAPAGPTPAEPPGAGKSSIRVPGPGLWQQRTRIVQVDVSDPARPRQVRSLDVDGTQVGARLSGGVARLTVTSSPTRLPLRFPADDRPGLRDAATEHNRSAVATADADAWLPRYTLVDGGRSTSGRLLECDEVAAPGSFSGLETLSMLAFDLRSPAGIARWERGGVVAAGATVYATAERTYVATSPWQEPGPAEIAPRGPVPLPMPVRRPTVSHVHAFATQAGAAPRYLASGEVPGALLNQFAMDEHEGHLRVASTVPAGWGGAVPPAGSPSADGDDMVTSDDSAVNRAVPAPTGPARVSESYVTVLRRSGDRLVQTGRVGGLGRNETIRSVRFMGALGYVVTFRQTDPLYTLDLSDPAAPRVTGELKIPGYSAYLHPVGNGMLLGVGQDADSEGMQLGLQMSLFDVSDVTAPRRVAQVRLPGAWSDAEGDHHAFTFAGGMALVPFSGETPAAGRGVTNTWDSGIVAVRVDGRTLSEPALLRPRLDAPVRLGSEWTAPETPLRTFVGDGEIVTVTDAGISLHDAGTLRRLAYRAY